MSDDNTARAENVRGPEVFSTRMVAQRHIAHEHYEMILAAHPALERTQPGQFLNFAVTSALSLDPLLRRPFSLYRRFPNGDCSIVYRVVGRGTALLAQLQPGDTVNILGPLGKGFSLIPGCKRPVLVGGGVGVPPVVYWAQQGLNELSGVRAFLGFGTAALAFGQDAFADLGIQAEVATVDGSLGHQGFVTELLAPVLVRGEVDVVYACGPKPMLAAVAALALEAGVPAQLAFEEVMGCGVGACLSCVIPIRTAAGVEYQRVCKEGPVFAADEVSFNG